MGAVGKQVPEYQAPTVSKANEELLGSCKSAFQTDENVSEITIQSLFYASNAAMTTKCIILHVPTSNVLK